MLRMLVSIAHIVSLDPVIWVVTTGSGLAVWTGHFNYHDGGWSYLFCY
jgi:hypothetical protein